jgi:hypothetical protein
MLLNKALAAPKLQLLYLEAELYKLDIEPEPF